MLRGILETLAAVYEVATVVTDVVLNAEYIHRQWIEEYILSIIFLALSGLVMGLLGLGLERGLPNRYARVDALNQLVAFLIGLLQLRVLTETAFAAQADALSERIGGGSEGQRQLLDEGRSNVNGAAEPAAEASGADKETPKERSTRLKQGLHYVAFVQSVVRDMPIFIIQANATIHYRKWKLLDILAVVLSALSLVRGVASYIGKEDSGLAFHLLTLLFVGGQFVFRLGVILLVAMTKGYVIVGYGLAITLLAIASASILRLAHPSNDRLHQLPRAIVFFPFFTFFVVDGSVLSARFGSAVPALRRSSLLPLHVWRIIENVVGVILAVVMPRYTDFGVSIDGQIITIACICGAIYAVSFGLFWMLAPRLDPSGGEKNGEHSRSNGCGCSAC